MQALATRRASRVLQHRASYITQALSTQATNNRTETRLREIISILFYFILPGLVSLLLFVTGRGIDLKFQLPFWRRVYSTQQHNLCVII